MMKTVRNHSGMVYACLLIEIFAGVVLTDHNRKIARWVKEDLIATDSKYGFQWDWLTMAS